MIRLKWDLTSEILIIIHVGVLENVTMLLVFPPERCLSLLVRLSEHPDMKYETHPRTKHRPGPPRVSNVLKLDIFTKFKTQFLNLSLFPIWCAWAKNIVIVCQNVSEAWNGRNILLTWRKWEHSGYFQDQAPWLHENFQRIETHLNCHSCTMCQPFSIHLKI